MEPADRRLWSKRVILMVNAAFPDGSFSTWCRCERYLAQALACLSPSNSAESDLPEAGELFYKAGYYLIERGRYKEAVPLLEGAIIQGPTRCTMR
jgi:tetratricopeptide (TPR) repeat protein